MSSKEIDIFSINEASSSSKAPTGDCRLLFEAATPEIFRNNAFRITGLNIDATPREISKKASELKMMAELGDVAGVDANCFALNPTEDQIKTALERLKDPQKRIIDEFFWFWPITEKSSDDDALSLIKAGKHDDALNLWWDARRKQETRATYLSAKHNIAVMMHMIALDWETGFHLKDELSEKHIGTLKDYWKDAFKIWESLVPNDELWSLVKKRVAQIDDPRLTTGFIRSFRNSLPEAFDKINGELAVKLARIGKQEAAKWHVDFMRETNQGLDDVDKTSELVLTPAREEIKHLIRTACKAGEKSPEKSDAAAIELLDKSRPLLSLFDMFFSEGGYSKNDIFDEVAQAYLNLLIQYANLTGKHERASELLKNVLPLAKSIDLREKIEASINIGKSNAEFELVKPIYEKLKSAQERLKRPSFQCDANGHVPIWHSSPDLAYAEIIVSIIPALARLTQIHGEIRIIGELKNSIAIVLLEISRDVFNSHRCDIPTAKKALLLAEKLAVDCSLKKHIKSDIENVWPQSSSWAWALAIAMFIILVIILVSFVLSRDRF